MKLVWLLCTVACGYALERYVTRDPHAVVAPPVARHVEVATVRTLGPPPPSLPDISRVDAPNELPPPDDDVVVQIDDAPTIYEGEDIPDTFDRCPDQPENVNGYDDEDIDGCPDPEPVLAR